MDDGIAGKLEILKRSAFRAGFKLGQKDKIYIGEKGLSTIRAHAVDFVSSRIAPRFPKNDGRQTPMRGHPAFIAQHATATCCRGCIRKWHGIEKGRPLNREEVESLVDLIMAWIQGQVEKNNGYRVQGIRCKV